MSQSAQNNKKSTTGFTTAQAYTLAVITLCIGIAMGYFGRGSATMPSATDTVSEIGNSVFMEYIKTVDGFEHLPKKNVDFGGGLERIAAAAINNPDIYRISVMWPIVEKLEQLSGKTYDANTNSMRVITDHLRAATFLAVDGITPNNKEQGYVMRRLLRRAIRFAFDLGIEQALCEQTVPIVVDLYREDYPEFTNQHRAIVDILVKEEKLFRQTLRKGLREFEKIAGQGHATTDNDQNIPPLKLNGQNLFYLYDAYGFPVELSKEEAFGRGIEVSADAGDVFNGLMEEQRLVTDRYQG